jgi:hypothetical protein
VPAGLAGEQWLDVGKPDVIRHRSVLIDIEWLRGAIEV